MKINDLSYSPTGARYGYNAQEQSTELNLEGNHTTAEYWEYDARSAKRWNLDPVVKQHASGYNTFASNPILNNDVLGNVEGQANLGVSVSLGTQTNFSLNASAGVSENNGSIMGAINISLNLYNGGLGTSQGSTGETNFQSDLVLSPSLTYGSGNSSPMQLNTFNFMSSSSITNNFENSFTISENIVFNTEGRNQIVGALVGKLNGGSVTLYNDLFADLLDDKAGYSEDRWWTGGGFANIKLGNGENTLSFGTEVFTGVPNYKTDILNPMGGTFGTYQLTDEQKLFNNGSTFLNISNKNGVSLGMSIIGNSILGNPAYAQNFIHNNLPTTPLFNFSNAKGSLQFDSSLKKGF